MENSRPESTYISLGTNAYKLSEEKIRYLLSIGVDKLNISLDSGIPEEHDKFRRRKGAFEKAMSAIENCRKVGMDFSINIVVHKDYTKAEGFLRLVDYAVRTRSKLILIAAVPYGEWESKHDVLITKDDDRTMRALTKKFPFIRRNCVSKRGCPAFDDLLAITSYGDVLPCDFIHASFGNLKNERLESIVQRAHKVKCFDGSYNGCFPAENKEFIENALPVIEKADPYPISAKVVFQELRS